MGTTLLVVLGKVFHWIGWVIISIAVSPYRRMLKNYTLEPLEEIRNCNEGLDVTLGKVKLWKEVAKKEEMNSVRLASTFAAAATIGIFSWPQIPDSFWVAQGLFYATLIFSIWAIIISFQQAHFLDELPTMKHGDGRADLKALKHMIPDNRGVRYWLLVFVWQFPAMLCSYSWCTFLAGLTIHVCSPFIRGDTWGDGKKISIFYMAVAGACLLIWVFASQMVHFVTNIPDEPPVALNGQQDTQQIIRNEIPLQVPQN